MRFRELLMFFIFLPIWTASLMSIANIAGGGRRWGLGVLALSLMVVAFKFHRLYREWMVMPAGVLVPQWSFRQFARTYHKYSSRDTVLSLSPTARGWYASLWKPQRRFPCSKKRLCEVEAIALLAAWQMNAPATDPLE